MISVFTITLNCVRAQLNEVYTRKNTNIILTVIAGIIQVKKIIPIWL